jgi:hypothetical protein
VVLRCIAARQFRKVVRLRDCENSSVVSIFGHGCYWNGVPADSHGGWQPKSVAKKIERALSQMLNSQDFRIRRFAYFADGPQAGRDECLSHFGRKFDAGDRHVIRKFGGWIDHDRLLSSR